MAKKKPRQDNSVIITSSSGQTKMRMNEENIVPEQPPENQSPQTRGSVTIDAVSPAPNPAQALTNILASQEERITKMQNTVEKLVTVTTNLAQSKAVEQEKPAGPQDMLKTIMDLLNGPLGNILNKVVDSIGAPAPTETPAANPVQEEQYKAVQKHNEAMEKFQLEWMGEMVRGVKLKNDQMDRELHAEW